MSIERVLANAQIVLGDEVIRGAVRFRNGTIDDISTGGALPAGADDLEGAYLLPGMVDLHTDEMERHMIPRSGVQWPLPVGAILAPRPPDSRCRNHHRVRFRSRSEHISKTTIGRCCCSP